MSSSSFAIVSQISLGMDMESMQSRLQSYNFTIDGDSSRWLGQKQFARDWIFASILSRNDLDASFFEKGFQVKPWTQSKKSKAQK